MEDYREAYRFSEDNIRTIYTQVISKREQDLGIRYESIIEKFISVVRDASLFVDVGSEYGLYTFLAVRENPDIDVYAIEGKPDRFAAFYDFIQNRPELRSRIFPCNFLISGKNGIVDMFQVNYRVSASLSCTGFPHYPTDIPTDALRAPCTTLDALFTGGGIDVMKMDIEGAEVLAFDGMKNVFAQRPKIFLEMHGALLTNLRSDGIEHMRRILEEFEYDSYSVKDGNIVKCNFPQARLYLCPRELEA